MFVSAAVEKADAVCGIMSVEELVVVIIEGCGRGIINKLPVSQSVPIRIVKQRILLEPAGEENHWLCKFCGNAVGALAVITVSHPTEVARL